VAALAIPATVTLLYATVSTYSWTGSEPASAGGAAQAGALPADLQALEERARAAPDDATGWINLGDAALGAERFAVALDAYRRALELAGGGASDELRLAFAEAAILVDRDALAGDAGRIIDEVLARNPQNAKALWYGGMAALGRGDAQAARSRWSRLLELAPPPQVREIIEQQLARLGAPGGVDGGAPLVAQTRIPVHISIKPELADRVRPGAALFLIARAPGAAGPPLAVIRREAARLPLDLEISDADSMVPGRTMASLPEVQVTARLANDGEALPAAGDVFGEAVWSAAEQGDGRLAIVMDQIVP
jgi:cytochrome c-type biogenesis protein CcmH